MTIELVIREKPEGVLMVSRLHPRFRSWDRCQHGYSRVTHRVCCRVHACFRRCNSLSTCDRRGREQKQHAPYQRAPKTDHRWHCRRGAFLIAPLFKPRCMDPAPTSKPPSRARAADTLGSGRQKIEHDSSYEQKNSNRHDQRLRGRSTGGERIPTIMSQKAIPTSAIPIGPQPYCNVRA